MSEKSVHDYQSMFIKALEQCKQWGFKDQITRACLSILSNIAEGMEKESIKEQPDSWKYLKDQPLNSPPRSTLA